MPEDFSEYNKTKKKKVKKRIRERSLKKFSEFIEKQIQDINQKDEIVDISNIDVDDLVLGNTAKAKRF